MREKESNMEFLVFIIVLIVIAYFGEIIYKCSHNEDYVYYGNKNYRFVTVWTELDGTKDSYSGVITVDDYNKWCRREKGVVDVYNAVKDDYKDRLSIDEIRGIKNYGYEPKWLPMNFWW